MATKRFASHTEGEILEKKGQMLYQKTLLNLTKRAQPCLGRISQKKKKNRTLKITHQVNYRSGSSSRQEAILANCLPANFRLIFSPSSKDAVPILRINFYRISL